MYQIGTGVTKIQDNMSFLFLAMYCGNQKMGHILRETDDTNFLIDFLQLGS